jgi:hypothetical protein
MEEIPIRSSIEEKIDWALRCHRRYGNRILDDHGVAELLHKLDGATVASREIMVGAGIVELCRHCEQHEGGSCCAVGMEDRYDAYLLLINLLLGVGMPETRGDPRGCYFLGENGCVLRSRDVICVNYLCKKVEERVDQERLFELRQREGEELATLFVLHGVVKRLVEALSSASE